jgi:hypothetical protein
MLEGRDVGDQPAVTTPPQGLAAHDDDFVGWDDGKQIRQPGSKLLAPGVRRVSAERCLGPPGVDLCSIGREMPSTAESLIPPVLDPVVRQPPLQCLTVHVRIPAAARVPAYVDEYVDPGIAQQTLQCDPVQCPMADGQQRHPSIVPRAGRGYGRGVADFFREDLQGSRFDRADLSGSEFRASDLSDTRFRGIYMSGVVMRGVELVDSEITGEIVNLTINGIDIGPLINAELDRQYPERARMRPTDPAGFREAWDLVERLWGETVDRAHRLDPELLHESVDGEWSFTETLRHLVFATDSWIRRGILGDPSPWDPFDLPWDEMPDMPGVPRDRDIRPSLDVVLELRRDRMSTVRKVIDGLTDQSLDGYTEAVEGPGWPESRSYPVRECLLVILNEEWEHRLYAERDLAALEARAS